VTTARLARELLDTNLVKLEVIGDPRTLFPDTAETLAAAKTLVADGFTVLPYISDDPVACMRLEELGCAAVMPLGAPIGSNRGVRTIELVEILVAEMGVPVIVDAGIGLPSHAAAAMEAGVDAILLNTAIATADDPVAMATAFRLAIEAGRTAFLAGPGPASKTARPSSPLTGFLGGAAAH
jgi:thiazole synthase